MALHACNVCSNSYSLVCILTELINSLNLQSCMPVFCWAGKKTVWCYSRLDGTSGSVCLGQPSTQNRVSYEIKQGSLLIAQGFIRSGLGNIQAQLSVQAAPMLDLLSSGGRVFPLHAVRYFLYMHESVLLQYVVSSCYAPLWRAWLYLDKSPYGNRFPSSCLFSRLNRPLL